MGDGVIRYRFNIRESSLHDYVIEVEGPFCDGDSVDKDKSLPGACIAELDIDFSVDPMHVSIKTDNH